MAADNLMKIAAMAGAGYLLYRYFAGAQPMVTSGNGAEGPQPTPTVAAPAGSGPTPSNGAATAQPIAINVTNPGEGLVEHFGQNPGWNFWQWNWHLAKSGLHQDFSLDNAPDPFSFAEFRGRAVDQVEQRKLTAGEYATLLMRHWDRYNGFGRLDSSPSWFFLTGVPPTFH